MKNKSGAIIKTVLGCYLVFLGVRILMQVTRTKPADSSMMTFLSAAFIGIGALYAFLALRQLIDIKEKKLSKERREKEGKGSHAGKAMSESEKPRVQKLEQVKTDSAERLGDATEDATVQRHVNLVSVGPEPLSDSQSEGTVEKKGSNQTESRAEETTDNRTDKENADNQKKQAETVKEESEDKKKKDADGDGGSQALKDADKANEASASKLVDPAKAKELNVNASEERETEVTNNETE